VLALFIEATPSEMACEARHNPVGLLRTGYYVRSEGTIGSRVASGTWWSTTSDSVAFSHYLRTHSAYVYPQYSNYRGFGFAVRCVVREG